MKYRIKDGVIDPAQNAVVGGAIIDIEGLWIEITGTSWKFSNGYWAALHYGMRSAANDLPLDDDVYYGKIGTFGHLVHSSEIEKL